jgi:hypothetical protein
VVRPWPKRPIPEAGNQAVFSSLPPLPGLEKIEQGRKIGLIRGQIEQVKAGGA